MHYLTALRPAQLKTTDVIKTWLLSGLAFHSTGINYTVWNELNPTTAGTGWFALPDSTVTMSGGHTFTSEIIFADKDKATIESFETNNVVLGGDPDLDNGTKTANPPQVIELTEGKTIKFVRYKVSGSGPYDWRATSGTLYKLGVITKIVPLISVEE